MRAPALPAKVVERLSHAFAELLARSPRMQPQQHGVTGAIAPSRSLTCHTPSALPPRPAHRDTVPALLAAPPSLRLSACSRCASRQSSPDRPAYRSRESAPPPSSPCPGNPPPPAS